MEGRVRRRREREKGKDSPLLVLPRSLLIYFKQLLFPKRIITAQQVRATHFLLLDGKYLVGQEEKTNSYNGGKHRNTQKKGRKYRKRMEAVQRIRDKVTLSQKLY